MKKKVNVTKKLKLIKNKISDFHRDSIDAEKTKWLFSKLIFLTRFVSEEVIEFFEVHERLECLLKSKGDDKDFQALKERARDIGLAAEKLADEVAEVDTAISQKRIKS